MATFTAVYDSCVLYPATIRDLLLELALTDLFRAKWSAAIHEEWMASLTKTRPDLKREKLERTRELMDLHVRDCLVTNYEDLIPALRLPDKKDRHVFAAAIRAGADVIVTYNIKDFPTSELSVYGIEAQHPDEFVMHLLDLAPGAVCASVKTVRARLKNPVVSTGQYLATLERLELIQTARVLETYAELL